MGVDLHNRTGKTFMANWWGWRRLLDNAFEYGWDPGRLASEHHYYHNDGQVVSAEDSTSIADALESYVKSMKARGTEDPEWIAYTEEFIEFCLHGSFKIW